jgi:hypothetical protein
MKNDVLTCDKNKILNVWQWCSEIYIQYGRKLTFPAHTDPSKTYQWRYAKAIAQKFEEWDFDEPTAKKFINIAIERSKALGIMHKGLAALHQKNLLDLCYKILQEECKNNDQSIELIKSTKDWLGKRAQDSELTQVLLGRDGPDSFCNLVKWYQASKISDLYLSLSKSCRRAIKAIEGTDERTLLPKMTTMYKVRMKFVEDSANKKELEKILGNDWKVPSCVNNC